MGTGKNSETGQEVALKLEHFTTQPSFLRMEYNMYKSLAHHAGFSHVYWFGQVDDFNVLVLELLGPNLEDLLRYCGGTFSLKTTLMLADQLFRRIKRFHSEQYVHRDIKPENFLLGLGKYGNLLYMTDLGLAIHCHFWNGNQG